MEPARSLKRRHVIALAFGAMVGWSWVLLTGPWIERAGVAGAVLAFLLAGVAMILIALTYAELASAMPELGGEHVYTRRAFGPSFSFICTWALLLGYVSVVAFEVVALPFALSYLFPFINVGKLWTVAGWNVYLSQVMIGIGTAISLTLINLRGVNSAANLQGAVTLVVVLSGLVLVSGAGIGGDVSNVSPLFVDGMGGVVGVIVMVPLMFVGFDVIPQAAEEIDLSPRLIGRLVIVSVVCAIAWYVLIIAAVGYILNADSRAAAELPTASAAATAWGHPLAGQLLVCGGIAGIVTTWNAFLVGSSRLLFVLSEHRMLPGWLSGDAQSEHRFGRILWVLCAVSCLAPWFGKPALVWLINAGSVGVIIAYAMVALSFLRLRQTEPDMPRPYRVPYGQFVGRAAVLMALAIGALYLPFSPSALQWPQEWLICALWFGLGGLFLATAPGRN